VNVEVIVRPDVLELLSEVECQRTLARSVAAAGAPEGATVTLTLSDDAELARLNKTHMGKGGPTDVLSFPLLPPSAFPQHPGQEPSLREDVAAFPLPPGEAVHLGDIIVSVERAIEQANDGAGGQTGDVSWEPADELRRWTAPVRLGSRAGRGGSCHASAGAAPARARPGGVRPRLASRRPSARSPAGPGRACPGHPSGPGSSPAPPLRPDAVRSGTSARSPAR